VTVALLEEDDDCSSEYSVPGPRMALIFCWTLDPGPDSENADGLARDLFHLVCEELLSPPEGDGDTSISMGESAESEKDAEGEGEEKYERD
jgi:hypothetical protein